MPTKFALINEEQLTALDERLSCHKEAKSAILAFIADAKLHGFDLAVASAYRSVEYQAQIVLNKFLGLRVVLDKDEQALDISNYSDAQKIEAICYFSALPGLSRHHLGSDFDIYPRNLLPQNQKLQLTAAEYASDGYFYPFLEYLQSNQAKFGFYTPYTGHNLGYEPWHISLQDLAAKELQSFDIDRVCAYLSNSDLPYRKAAIDYARLHYQEMLAL